MWWINTVWTTPSRIKGKKRGKCKLHYLNFYTYRIYYINGCRSSQIHKFSPDKIWNLHPYLNLRWGMNLKLLNREHKYTYIYIYMERNWVIKREVKTKIKTEKTHFPRQFPRQSNFKKEYNLYTNFSSSHNHLLDCCLYLVTLQREKRLCLQEWIYLVSRTWNFSLQDNVIW